MFVYCIYNSNQKIKFMQLKTTVSVARDRNQNLETPAFFKEIVSSNITKYLGVMDECTISIFLFPNKRTSIENDATEDCVRQISEAYNKWEHISEEEFFESLDKALKDFNFKPSLRVVTAKEGSEITI